MAKFLNKLSNLLEAIDNKAAETASSAKNKESILNNNYDNDSESFNDINDNVDDAQDPLQKDNTQEELENLKQITHQDQVRLVTLEDQLKEAKSEHSKLSELSTISSNKDKETQNQLQQKKRELIKLKADFESQNREIQNDSEINEKANYSNFLSQLKSDLEKIQEENSQIELNLSNKENKIDEIQKKIEEKNELIKSIEIRLTETRTKAINKLTDSVESTEFLSNVEKYEKQRVELKESIQKNQQKISALEASIVELQEEANLEIKEENQVIENIQTELFKIKTTNETIKHEIELINNQSQQELAEIEKTYQNLFENNKNMNENEIKRIRFKLESDNIDQDRNIDLIKAQAEIDQLQIKKAELLSIIEKNKEIDMNKKKYERNWADIENPVPLVTLLPHFAVDALYQPVENIDRVIANIGHFFQSRPLLRILTVVLFIILNILVLLPFIN